MPAPKVSDAAFIALAHELNGNVARMAERIGTNERQVYARRDRIEKRLQISLPRNADCNNPGGGARRFGIGEIEELDIDDGLIVAAGDIHSLALAAREWPYTRAMQALHRVLEEIGRDVVLFVNTGDTHDGVSTGRYDALGWLGYKPTVAEEIEAGRHDLRSIEERLPRETLRRWTVGNHDSRFDAFLAKHAPSYEGVEGMCLADKFPQWTMVDAIHINGRIIAAHNIANGVHAAHNNAMKTAASVITGHTHALKVVPWQGAFETFYGIECGTLADPRSPAFQYLRGRPTQWAEGFQVIAVSGRRIVNVDTVRVQRDGAAWWGARELVTS